jgi:hypothetical protein
MVATSWAPPRPGPTPRKLGPSGWPRSWSGRGGHGGGFERDDQAGEAQIDRGDLLPADADDRTVDPDG